MENSVIWRKLLYYPTTYHDIGRKFLTHAVICIRHFYRKLICGSNSRFYATWFISASASISSCIFFIIVTFIKLNVVFASHYFMRDPIDIVNVIISIAVPLALALYDFFSVCAFMSLLLLSNYCTYKWEDKNINDKLHTHNR